MTFAPSNETSSTTPNPARSAVNHRCKPMRPNKQAKGAGTRTCRCRLNSVVMSSSLPESFVARRRITQTACYLRLREYVTRIAAPMKLPAARPSQPLRRSRPSCGVFGEGESISPKLTLRIHQRQHSTPLQATHGAAVHIVTNEREATEQSLKR